MGAIIGALIGRHLAHQEEQHQVARSMVFAPVADYLRDPTSSNYTPEEVDRALEAGMKMNYFPKNFKDVIGPMIEAGKSKWQAARNLEVMNRLQGNAWGGIGGGGKDLGVPTSDPTSAPAPAAGPASAPVLAPKLNLPGAGIVPQAPPPVSFIPPAVPPPGAPPPGLAPPPAAPPVPGQGLMGLFGPQAPPQPSRFAGGPPGVSNVPLVPFANGTGTGPVPIPDEKPAMRTGSLGGTTGFGGPSVVAAKPMTPGASTPPDASASPAVPPMTLPDLSPEFWVPSRSPQTIRTIRGQMAAAEALPTLQQAKQIELGSLPAELQIRNQAAIEQQGNMYAQEQQQRITEQNRIMGELRKNPEFNKLPPLQQLEMAARVMGMQGQISPLAHPQNVPSSQIHGPEIPEGALDLQGNPIDRSKGKWYRQRYDISTGETRYYPITPSMTPHKLFTDNGYVNAFYDPAGNLQNAQWSVNGSPITDKAFLEKISTKPTKFTTVDQNGDPVTDIRNVTSSTRLARPGGGPPAAAPGAGGAQAPAPRTGGAPTAGAGVGVGPSQGSIPQPLTAATRRSSEFARSMQQHYPEIKNAITELDKRGELGTIASRWNEFKAGTLGAGDPAYTALRTNMSLFDSALGVVHQTKGKHMLEHFKELADSGKMDVDTLRSAVDVMGQWMDTYANMGANRPGAVNTGGPMNNPPAGTPKARKPLADYFK